MYGHMFEKIQRRVCLDPYIYSGIMVDPRSIISYTILLLSFLFLFESTFEQQSEPLSSRVERVALLELRSSLGLRSKDWPLKADPCFLWRGVQCENGRVVGINISGFRRTRLGRRNPQFAVDALANFTFLTTFNASNFFLPGSIPNWFGQRLRSLQVIDLRSCSMIGTIPLSLGNLTNLIRLYLSNNNLNGSLPSFTNLDNIYVLDISSNSLSGSIPFGIGALSKLQILNLSSNNLSSSVPAQLGDLGNLVELDLSFNSLSGSMPQDLRGLRNLEKMALGNNFIGGSLPNNLFSAMPKLQFIVLRNNAFTGILPSVLCTRPALRFLDISGNNFTGQLPNYSSNANATSAVVNISQNLFYGGLTPLLQRFTVVDLSGNYFEGRILAYESTNFSVDHNCLQNSSNQRSLEQCASFYAERGLTFDKFGLLVPPSPPSPGQTSGKNNKKVIILAAVLGGFGLIVLLVLLLVLLFLCVWKKGANIHRGVGVGSVPAGCSPSPLGGAINYSVGDAFTYEQLLQATSDLSDSNLIKHGHSGDIFRGVLGNGIPVVVKRINLQLVKKEAYLLELNFFSKVSHVRFVSFLGHCSERENEKFLVYKHVTNGDLSSSLYKKTNNEDDGLQSYDWITRLKIALGAAEGLSYLHHECNPPFVHRDVQASSILLDDKFEVRLGSLSEVCSEEGDSHQSRITNLLRLPQSSEQGASGMPTAVCAHDVYCFGKVLLELVTGKLGISACSNAQVKEWLERILPYISIFDKEPVTKIVDPSLIVDEDLLEEVWAMAIVAKSCLNPKPSRRPSMRYVLKALENPWKVVRQDNFGSARLRTTSSRGSRNAAVFGSWHSWSDVPAISGAKAEGVSALKHSGNIGSQGIAQNGAGEHSSSHRRSSREIFPEPSGSKEVEKLDQDQ